MTIDRIREGLDNLRHVVWGLLLCVLVLAVGMTLLGWHVLGRQTLSDDRNDNQRQALCAILSNIPGHVPVQIAKARDVFARPGHPNDCKPRAHLRPTASPAPRHHAAASGQASAPSPVPARTASPRPKPRPSPKPSPSPTHTPSPSPSPGCHPLKHPLHCIRR